LEENNVKLAQIEAFYSVIRAGSISQAARQMHLTQPALSLQIRDLEEFFKVKLLERSNKGVKPTPAGGLVYYYGQKLMSMKETLCSEIEKLQCGMERPLLIGASTVPGGYTVPGSIHRFQEENPGAQVQLTVSNCRKIMEMLIDGNLDVAIIEGPIPDDLMYGGGNLVSQVIGHDELVVVASPAAVADGMDSVSGDKLRELPLILREHGSGIRYAVEKVFSDLGLTTEQMNITMEFNSIDTIKGSLAVSRRFSILSLLSVSKEVEFGMLKALKIKDYNALLPITMIHAKQSFMPPCLQSFIDFMSPVQ
jgi:LysR family transcriptional regulator, transcriptional activator of the cysJI operon